MSELISVSLHPSTLALLAAIADTERNSASNDCAFRERRGQHHLAKLAQDRLSAWAITASNLNIAAEKEELKG